LTTRLGADGIVAAIGDAVAPFGVNLVGVARQAAYDALVPPQYRLGPTSPPVVTPPLAGVVPPSSIVVLGNGGGAFWAAFRAHVSRHPAAAARPHPLDDFTRDVMESAVLPVLARDGVAGVLRLPFDDVQPPLSFVHLAEAAGLGRRSLVGVLVHPEFGPWMALRGALLLHIATTAARPAAGFDPCAVCRERPCIAACPTAAVAASGWSAESCAAYRVAETGRCDDGCHARLACVYGRAHHYPADAIAYHQGRARSVMERVLDARRRSGPTGS
jgi:hypothetical protein